MVEGPASAIVLDRRDVAEVLAPYVLARDREERKRESKALQATSKRNKAAKRKQGAGEGKASEEAESKPRAVHYSKDSKPVVVISDLIPFKDAQGQTQLLIVVEGATAFFHVPVSTLLAPLPSDEKVRNISEQIHVTRAPTPFLKSQ